MKKTKAGMSRSAGKRERVSAKATRVAKSGKKASATGKGGPKDVDEYIAAAAEPARGRLKEMRAVIRSAVPADAVEIISYQIPAFKQKKVLVWYAAFSGHCRGGDRRV
jgi:hypothetical protein